MLEPGEDADLAEESLLPAVRDELAAEDLHRHRTVVAHILGVDDDRHPAPGRHALQAVPVGEMWSQTVEKVRHPSGPKVASLSRSGSTVNRQPSTVNRFFLDTSLMPKVAGLT